MKSAPATAYFCIRKHKTEIYEIDFAIRIDLVYRIYFHLYSISTVIWNGRYNAPELRVPTSVKPAFDYWMRDTWATLGPDGYYYITGTTSTPRPLLSGTEALLGLERRFVLVAFQRYEVLGTRGQIWSMEKTEPGKRSRKYMKQERNIRRNPSTVIRWTTASMQCGLRKCIISKARRTGLSLPA